MTRPLTERQARTLTLFALGHLSHYSERSMPSLEGRGLVEHWRDFGSGFNGGIVRWRLTDAGNAEVERIRAERDAKAGAR